MTPFISFERAAIKCGSWVQTVVCGRLFSTPWLCAAIGFSLLTILRLGFVFGVVKVVILFRKIGSGQVAENQTSEV